MSKNAMIMVAVVAIVIFSYMFWKKRQALPTTTGTTPPATT